MEVAVMKVEVRLFAGLHKYTTGVSSGVPFEVELGSSATGLDLLEKLGIPIEEAFVFMANGSRAELGSALQEGDRVGIFPPVGGG